MKKQKIKTSLIEKTFKEVEIEVYCINIFGKTIYFNSFLNFLFEFRFPKDHLEYITLTYSIMIFLGIPFIAYISGGLLFTRICFVIVMWVILTPVLFRVKL